MGVASRVGIGVSFIALLGFILAPSAMADISFCSFGSAAARCEEPSGVAVDRSVGDVYVADRRNHRINVFTSEGGFRYALGWGVANGSPNAQTCGPDATPPTATCLKGLEGSGTGQFSFPRRVAVDNNPSSPNFQDIYVTDSNLRVQKFNSTGEYEAAIGNGQLNRGGDPIAIGPGNNLYVFDSTIDVDERQVKIFSPTGILAGSSILEGTEPVEDGTVNSSGEVYVSRIGASGAVEKYSLSEPNATHLASFDSGANTKVLAVDDEDNLFAAQFEGPSRVIAIRDPSGAILKRFGYGEIELNLQGLAVGKTGELFGSEEFFGPPSPGNRVIRIPQPPPGPLPCCVTVNPGNTKATLNGQVNPEGKATTYHFDYIAEADFIANGNSFSGPHPATSTADIAIAGSDFVLHPAQAQIGCPTPTDPPQSECLKPETKYHVRLIATNADDEGEKNSSAEVVFESKNPFEVTGTWSTAVGLTDAQIHASINPLGIPATGFFEYVDDTGFQAGGFVSAKKSPLSPIDLGAGNADVTADAQLTALVPNTLYHYRVVVANSFVEEAGPEQTFLTYPPRSPIPPCGNDPFRVGPSALLTNCRAYEMVSPIDKNGGDVKAFINNRNFPTRLDQSSADGNSLTYSAVPAFADPKSAPFMSQYIARREADAWSNEAVNPPRDSVSLTDQLVRLEAQYKLFSPDLDEGWLFQDANPPLGECAPEGFINLYRRDSATGDYEALVPAVPPSLPSEGYRLELQGTSVDGSRAVFRANAKLTGNAAGGSKYQLYMHIRDGGCGQLRLVSVRPNGAPGAENASAGSGIGGPGEYHESTVARAISATGSRVFFSLSSLPTNTGELYVRVNADQVQSAISAGKCTQPDNGCTLLISAANAQFWTAATDGSTAIYSVGGNLFGYDVNDALTGGAGSTLIAVNAKGVVGASQDASRVYFVSTSEIDSEGEPGKPNLYLFDQGKTGSDRYRLVATLSNFDQQGFQHWGFTVASAEPIRNGVRLTPDGSRLAFVSTASLTGYDNTDAVDGRPNLEVFFYDAEVDDLSCISCNPSGARPTGREFGPENSVIRRVSGMIAPGETQNFFPRALTESGDKLFFESFESLLPRDVNKKADVYEWERATGQKACEEEGAELYVSSSGGCLSLISSGQDEADSEFADASPNGSDVFVRTASSLLPQDPGQVDVYDVREGGGLPIPPLPGPICETEENPQPCQISAQPPTDPTPGTQSPSAGNIKPKSCPKGKVLRKGKCVRKTPKGKGKGKKRGASNDKGARR